MFFAKEFNPKRIKKCNAHKSRVKIIKNKNRNLIYLLEKRYFWMNKFIKKKKNIIELGSGNGVIKERIPEAESDYIFSVIAEEYGLIGCLMLLTIFFIIAYNGFMNVYNNNNHFIQIGLFSLVVYFCLQALIHIAVNIRLIPTTGITLPFISYGGSSILGMSVTCGFIMMFSKKRHNR